MMSSVDTTRFKTARSLYNSIAQKYHSNREKASNDVNELPAVLKLLGNIKGKQVLDMGCGLGKHAKEFIKRGAVVTGYDASDKMLQLTKEYCGNKGTFFRATHETVSFKPSSFDICNASFTLNYTPNVEMVVKRVYSWLKLHGIFTFSIPHPIWLLKRSDNMDYSKPHRIWVELTSYEVDVFNYYYPLDTIVQLVNKYHFQLLNLIETTIPKKYKGWPEEKYRLPNAHLFKLQKMS